MITVTYAQLISVQQTVVKSSVAEVTTFPLDCLRVALKDAAIELDVFRNGTVYQFLQLAIASLESTLDNERWTTKNAEKLHKTALLIAAASVPVIVEQGGLDAEFTDYFNKMGRQLVHAYNVQECMQRAIIDLIPSDILKMVSIVRLVQADSIDADLIQAVLKQCLFNYINHMPDSTRDYIESMLKEVLFAD